MNTTTKQILDGVALILKYEPDADFESDEDAIYFGTYETRKKMTPEEQAQMEEWGWARQFAAWRHYV